MSFFLKWYLRKLQTHPFVCNTSTAVVMMTTGDALAQTIETTDIVPIFEANNILSNNSLRIVDGPISFYYEEHNTSRTTWKVETDGKTLDLSRVGTMAAWATLFYAPFYMTLYNVFDRYLPRHGPLSIASRVGLSFAASVPVNAAFYVYGEVAQHAVEYVSNKKNGVPSSFQWQSALESAQRKVEAELTTTVTTSAMVWVPINMINFSIVPVRFRPLTLMAFSAGWNCFLSLKQHRG